MQQPQGQTQTHLWIGNIPYDATEEELKAILSTVGGVVSVRLRYEKDTGQSKGFAFCEFRDPESSVVAIETLNGFELRGRALRVDWATAEMKQRHLPPQPQQPQQPPHPHPSANRPGDFASAVQALLPPGLLSRVGVGTDGLPGELGRFAASLGLGGFMPERKSSPTASAEGTGSKIAAEVADLMGSLTTAQLFYILGHMQRLVVQAPDVARALLSDNPQLCCALLHAQFVCGIIDEPFLPLDVEALRAAEAMRREREVAVHALYEKHRQAMQQQQQMHSPTLKIPGPPPRPPSSPPVIVIPRESAQMDPEELSVELPSYSTGDFEEVKPEPDNGRQEEAQSEVVDIEVHDSRTSNDADQASVATVFPSMSPTPPPPPIFQQLQPEGAPQPNAASAASALLDQIARDPQFIDQLMKCDPSRETTWTEEERSQVWMIQEALRQKGILR